MPMWVLLACHPHLYSSGGAAPYWEDLPSPHARTGLQVLPHLYAFHAPPLSLPLVPPLWGRC